MKALTEQLSISIVIKEENDVSTCLLPLGGSCWSPQYHDHQQDNREQNMPESFSQPQFGPFL